MITIFTDGAARGNPGPGGWGTVIATRDSVVELGGREDHTTNNRMEIMAAISGLESAPKQDSVTLYTDSAYVLSGITRWVIGWQRNNWKTSQKEDVLNRDLWERLMTANSHRLVNWKLLKGHSGIPANERCDFIATSFADQKNIVLYNGSRERYGVSLEIPKAPAKPLTRKGRSKPYSYVSLVDGIISIFKTWDECKEHVHGVPDAKYKKSISPSDEEDIVAEFREST